MTLGSCSGTTGAPKAASVRVSPGPLVHISNSKRVLVDPSQCFE